MHLPNVIIAVFICWLLSLLYDSTDATVTGISFEGCFKNLSHYTTHRNLSDKNGPRNCFDECNNTEYIGLQKQDCFCNATRGPYATERDCDFSCPGDRNFSCGSDNAIYVYYKEQTNISVYGDFGFVYLHMYKPDVHYIYGINGANDITEKRHYICYDDASKCDFQAVGTEMTWQEARAECLLHNKGLVPYRIAIDETICTPALPSGYFWIGMSWFKPVATSTATTATSTPYSSSKTTLLLNSTTGSRPNYNSTAPVIEETSKASSSDGISPIVVAAPIAVIVVAILAVFASILICKKRKLLCFKHRHNSTEMDESKSDAPLEIPQLISSRALSSIPPGSTRATFQSHYQNGRPATKRERDIQSGQSDQTLLNSNKFYTNMSDNTQNRVRSDMKDREKRKKKREKKKIKKDKHKAVVDKEYEEIEANDNKNVDILDRRPNDNLSAVNGATGHPNGEGGDNEKKMKKKKKKRTREDSYSDNNMNNASAEPGSAFVSGHHSKRPIASSALVKVQDTGKQPDQPNDKVSDTRREKTEQYEILRETQIETLTKEYDGLFVAPAETPVIEDQIDENIERLGREHKEKRRKDKERVNEYGAQQEDLNLNEVHKEPNVDNIDNQKDKKKKRKKSRERSKEKVLNGYNEIVDAPAGTSFLQDPTDLQNESSNKKHKKRKRKKDKKRIDEDVAEEEGLDLAKDENDDAAAHSL